MEELKKYFHENKDAILNDYYAFLRFASISTEKEHKDELIQCMEWLREQFDDIGFETEVWETTGHPTLYAENLEAGSTKPTLLIYNHYDVQPIDPLELWSSPPFEPTVKENEVFARGAQDNKGQCMYALQAVKALKQLEGTLPINIKWVIEGEEEMGSEGLNKILEVKKEKLQADYLAIIDVGIPSRDTPAVTLGVRGIVTMDVEVSGSNTDLHSGTHGGRAYNPIHALVEVLAKLRDKYGKVQVPGFYDDVEALSDEDRGVVSFDFDEEEYLETFGIKATGGEWEYPPLERSTIRPTLEVNGINGGYSGSGFKTVIPAKAFAKISCRLVPQQDPETIGQAVAKYVESLAPEGIKVNVNVHHGGGGAVRAQSTSKVVEAFAQAYTDVFGTPCKYIFEGGSIPIVTNLSAVSGGDVVLVGMGLNSDQIHAPDEHFGLDRFEQGFYMVASALRHLGGN